MKGVIEALLESLHVKGALAARAVNVGPFTEGNCAELTIDGTHLAYLGEIADHALAEFDLRKQCTAAEIDFDVLLKRADLVAQQRLLPAYPTVVRDLSLEVARAVPWSELQEVVVSAAGSTLETVTYLDTFRGGNLADDMQSIHFGMVFRHPDRTLTGEEVERAVHSVVEACQRRFSAKLRT